MSTARKYNFLVFAVDQMQSAYLGANGHPSGASPAIDTIAADGVTFRRAYCNGTVCMPSRASLLTGLTPNQHGCLTNGTKLPTDVPTVTQVLANHGYRTHSVGKLHLQPFGGSADIESWECRSRWDNKVIDSLPLPYYGYQTVDFLGGHVYYSFGDYRRWLDEHDPSLHSLYAKSSSYHSVGAQAWRMRVPPGMHYNDWIADRSVAFLEQHDASQPFFLWCSFPDPHHPFAATEPYSEMFDPSSVPISSTWSEEDEPLPHLARFRRERDNMGVGQLTEEYLREATAQSLGMIRHVDASIGRVMESLDRLGLRDSTIVVFVADHGEYLGSHGHLLKGPWPYEELSRVPFVWSIPDAKSRKAASDDVVSLLDFVPTVLDFAGMSPVELDMRKMAGLEPTVLPGRSLRRFLDGVEPLPSRPALIELDSDSLVLDGMMCRLRCIVKDQIKLCIYAGLGNGLLYDLAFDPEERVNRFGSPEYRTIQTDLTELMLHELVRAQRLDQERLSIA